MASGKFYRLLFSIKEWEIIRDLDQLTHFTPCSTWADRAFSLYNRILRYPCT